MVDLTRCPNLLRLISCGYMARAVLRRRRNDVRQSKSHRAQFYEQVWRAAAEDLGARAEEVVPGILEFTLGDARAAVRSNYTPLDDPVTLALAGNKPFVHRRLRELDLPTPDFVEFSLKDFESATRFLAVSDIPCVVKPAGCTGAGQGISTGIRTRSQLAWASAIAARYGDSLLIERQVPGDNYRLLYLDGVLLDAIKRHAPSIVGDGKSTIRALLRRENSRRNAGWQAAQVLIHADAEMRRTLADQRLTFRSVPEAGRRVMLKTVINENAARENEDAASELCDHVVEAGSRAALGLGVRLAGVDVITPDASRPLEAVGGVILEVNTTPGLYHHKRGDACPVATTLLEAVFESKQAITATSY